MQQARSGSRRSSSGCAELMGRIWAARPFLRARIHLADWNGWSSDPEHRPRSPRQAAQSCLMLAIVLLLTGCATVRTMDAAKPGAPLVYSGTRLDWYSLNGGCCPLDRFGTGAPRHAALDLPASVLLDTLLLPLSLAAVLGLGLNVQGGL